MPSFIQYIQNYCESCLNCCLKRKKEPEPRHKSSAPAPAKKSRFRLLKMYLLSMWCAQTERLSWSSTIVMKIIFPSFILSQSLFRCRKKIFSLFMSLRWILLHYKKTIFMQWHCLWMLLLKNLFINIIGTFVILDLLLCSILIWFISVARDQPECGSLKRPLDC